MAWPHSHAEHQQGGRWLHAYCQRVDIDQRTSSTFNVNAGTVNKLAFTVQPSNVTVGSTISPSVAVSVEDSLGNVVTSATNSITVAIGTNPSAGTLGGTLTVAAVNGVASFSTLNINIAGTGYTLTAGAATLTSAASNTFNVTANCTNNCSISGTVTGDGATGVKITLSSGPSTPAPAVTNASGAYSFTGLTQGTYTITPSLTGYSYAPASAPSVSIGASTGTELHGFLRHFVVQHFRNGQWKSGLHARAVHYRIQLRRRDELQPCRWNHSAVHHDEWRGIHDTRIVALQQLLGEGGNRYLEQRRAE